MAYDLEFERPLADLDKQIQGIQRKGDRARADERRQLPELQEKLERQSREIYGSLGPWQRVQMARHRERPYTADYIKLMCDEFFELHGDRRHSDDHAIMGGLASIDGMTLMLIGHQKGRDTRERQECNFGMAHAEGYRKAERLMRQAERFHMPVVTLLDTAGASLDLEAEQRGIAQAIAENLLVMARLRTPILAIVIGEGGSGGALALSVADRILMMENAIYTVAAPEAAASILWRDSSFAPSAAEAMKISAPELLELGLIEGIIAEPLGGAHRDHRAAAATVKDAISANLAELEGVCIDKLVELRYQRFRRIGSSERETIGAHQG
jgi:acetyl-CoA carboxylase carboxyl transferase subunit alpha